MTEPKVYGGTGTGTLVAGYSIPFKIPGNKITRGNLTVLTPEDFPRTPDDQIIFMRLLSFGSAIRNPIVVEFAKVRDPMWVQINQLGPTDAQPRTRRPLSNFIRAEKSFNDLFKVLEGIYGRIELKSRIELQQDFWLGHRDDGPKESDGV